MFHYSILKFICSIEGALIYTSIYVGTTLHYIETIQRTQQCYLIIPLFAVSCSLPTPVLLKLTIGYHM